MSRSGYSDDCEDQWSLIRWRGAVAAAIRGRRGQAFLRETLVALDAIPSRSLIAYDLENLMGVCALGAVGRLRGLDMSVIDLGEIDEYEARDELAAMFDIAPALAAEIMFWNDEMCSDPEARWQVVRRWVERHIHP